MLLEKNDNYLRYHKVHFQLHIPTMNYSIRYL